MDNIKTTEAVVLRVLERNKRARTDDFILYGAVIKHLGVDLNTSLYTFLSTAKEFLKVPTFETVTRCRRHIQQKRPELKNCEIATLRENHQSNFKNYNLTGIGE